ncbi:MAG TPA: acetate/propionate family kinase [Edaphobacter sp.]|nr:acetate/propionate family kinase [Edaphobacter sp.]
MNLLVLNSGSSSIKCSVFAADQDSPRSLFEGEVSRIGSEHAAFSFHRSGEKQPSSPVQARNPTDAIDEVLNAVTRPQVPHIDAVGYRVVHPGPSIHNHVRIDDGILDELDRAATFAPLHDPPSTAIIRETRTRFPDVPHFACFDTIFHQTMPEVASVYAIPSVYREQGVHRYGAHGLSCESIVEQLRRTHRPIPQRMAIAHLGSGCSVTALVNGISIDTTMGLTPTGGVVMGTRPGDLDPGVILYLLRQMAGERDRATNSLEQLLNHSSGIASLSGLPNDMRDIRKAAADGNHDARLAIDVFTRSIRKTLGSFSWVMGGLDAIIFTGGIGEHDSQTRAEILDQLQPLGIHMDATLNVAAKPSSEEPVQRLSTSDSKTDILLVPAKEDWMIAIHLERMLKETH